MVPRPATVLGRAPGAAVAANDVGGAGGFGYLEPR